LRQRQAEDADERACLLITAILGKAGNNVSYRRVDWIGFTDPLNGGLRRCGDRIDALSSL
jgi:hypothetical protein